MSSPSASHSHPESRFPSWLPVGAVFLLLTAANWPVIAGLFRTWWISYSEMGHGFLAPPLAAYALWLERDKLRSLPVQGVNWALLPLAAAGALIVVSSIANWVFPSQLALWAMIFFALLYLLGRAWVRALAFPLILLAFTIPPPSFLYTRLTFEMQLLASRLGEFGLSALGYTVLREGNVLRMANANLSVAEACSGIRSFITLTFFFVVYGYFTVQNGKVRGILLAAVAPVAVLANGLRIVATGVLAQYNPAWAEGLTHEISGYITLFLGGFFLILLGQRLERRPSHAVA